MHTTEQMIEYYVRRDGAAGFTRTSTSTFTVTDNAKNQGFFKAGLPIRYRTTAGSGSWSYGIIKSYSSGTVAIMGISLPSPLGELCIGPDYKVFQVSLQVAGDLATGDDQIKTVMNTEFRYGLSDGFCVGVRGQVETAASGADLHISVGIGGTSNDLFSSPTYLNLAQATTAVDSAVNISSTHYSIVFLEKFYVNIDQIGSTTPGSDLTLLVLGVLP